VLLRRLVRPAAGTFTSITPPRCTGRRCWLSMTRTFQPSGVRFCAGWQAHRPPTRTAIKH